MSEVAGTTLSAATIAAVDSAGQLGDILAMPDHIADAQWRAESAMLASQPAQQLIVCGLGGSAIGADLAVAALGDRLKQPIHVVRDYDLPSWVTADSAILLSSYSGATEETLSCYRQAIDLGAKIYLVSSGGPISEQAHANGHPLIGLPGVLQPRAAVAYGIVATLEIGIVCGIVDPAIRQELNAAAELLCMLAGEWGPDATEDAPSKRLARAIDGHVPVVYGADLTAPVAYRWKCQINENVKLPAWNATLSESNHNEICSWEGAGDVVSQLAWFLRDADQHDRVKRRIDLNAGIVREHGATAEVIDTRGESRVERLFSSVFLGDLVSLYAGVLRGNDPSPVPIIEGLKDALGRPTA
ncbi:MAG: bifunctional phosphoglucose/phosphomannose isomerase [Solirubrobacterales bacterium]